MSSFARIGSFAAAALLGIVVCVPKASAQTAESTKMEITGAAGLKWTPLVVPGFPSGGKMAVLHGNPGGDGDYTLRLKFPSGYEFPLHWHPGGEHLTVLSGSFHLGMQGEKKAKNYVPGDFLYIPGRMSHFGGARGTTVIQLHGTGPFAINLGTAQ